MVRHWLTVRETRLALADGDQRVRRRADRGGARRWSSPRSSSAGAYLVVILVPTLVAMMLFISRQYGRSKRELAVGPGPRRPRPHREERVVVPIPGLNRAVVQAINVGPLDQRRHPRGLHRRRPGAAARRCATDFERRSPGVPLVVVESPYRALVGPLLAYLDVLDARLAAGQAGADHVRRHPRVRRPLLVGADPLQPGRQAAADRPARPAAHRRRERARTGARTGTLFERRRAERRGAPPPGAQRPTREPEPVPSAARPGGIVTAAHVRDPHARLPTSGHRPQRRPERRPRSCSLVAEQAGSPRPSSSPSTSSRSTGPCRSTPTSPADPRRSSGPRHRRGGRRGHPSCASSRSCSRRATSARPSSTRPPSAGRTCSSLGLPYRNRFGGEFAIGRTIPYILQNAPCAVWVVREPMTEEPS